MNLSKILNVAVERGFLKLNTFPQLRLKKDEVDKDFLTDDDLDRDAFVFSCLTGLAFIDIKTTIIIHRLFTTFIRLLYI